MAQLVYLDDDRIQHLLMKKMTKIFLPDCKAEFFTEPQSLSSWLGENRTNLIVSDLNLEGDSGWEWVAEFASKSAAPIVFVTASASPEDRLKAAGFSTVKSVMEKPLSEENWQQLADLIQGE